MEVTLEQLLDFQDKFIRSYNTATRAEVRTEGRKDGGTEEMRDE
jgi:hypothetical protein